MILLYSVDKMDQFAHMLNKYSRHQPIRTSSIPSISGTVVGPSMAMLGGKTGFLPQRAFGRKCGENRPVHHFWGILFFYFKMLDYQFLGKIDFSG